MISFVVAGLIVIAVMRSLAEMVSVRPLSGALIDFPYTFVDPALGFAVGIMYWLVSLFLLEMSGLKSASHSIAQCLSMATLTSAAARVADNFLPDGETLAKKRKAGIITGLLLITLLSNACGVEVKLRSTCSDGADIPQLYGRLERIVKWSKYIIILGVCVLMILINVGGEQDSASNTACSEHWILIFPVGGRSFGTTSELSLGPRLASTDGTGYTEHALVPSFRWAGFNSTADSEDRSGESGIPGDSGRFLAVWYGELSPPRKVSLLIRSDPGSVSLWQYLPVWAVT